MNRPVLMGILNATPDSFSDGGRSIAALIDHAQAMAEAGADILDIGAESTRPGATPISAEEEWARLEPVLAAIYNASWHPRVRISIDTRNAQTAGRALEFGVEIINDVTSLRDDAMGEMLGEHSCDIVVMHALSVPADLAVTLPEGCDPIVEILKWKSDVTARAEALGINAERLIYDPGLGFGKTAAQSMTLVQGAAALVQSGGRWLVGHSRKSFLGGPVEQRDAATLGLSLQLARTGITYLRVHDVASHAAMLDKLCM